MPTHPQLRADLMKKLGGISKQRLSDRVAQVKKAHGPMTTEDAVNLLAHQGGLDLPRYLDPETVDRVRGMLQLSATRAPMPAAPTAPMPAAPTAPKSLPQPSSSRPPIRIDTDPPNAPLLSAAVADDAKVMAKVYLQLYVLENSARDVIHRVMTAKVGKDWWSKKAGSKVQQRVQGRIDKEGKEPWTGKRGAHEISYSDFGDFERIILNNWSDFQDILGSTSFVTSTLGGLEPLRNITAHNDRATKKEVDRLRIHFDDWVKQIDGRRAMIP